MKKGLLALISGSSGVGKNTIIAKLLEDDKNMKMLKSCTSRAIRVDDKVQEDGKYAYEFLTKEEFETKIENNEIIEYDIFSGNYYGVSKNSVEDVIKAGKVGIKDITVKGVLSCKDKLSKNVDIVSIFLTLDKSKLKKRLVLRETKDIKERMRHYAFEQKSIPLYDYCILNDNLELTLSKMRAILKTAVGQEILVGESIDKVNEKKIEKIITKLKTNKKIKPIKVMERDGYIYIVEGFHTYLASITCGIAVNKWFVDNKNIVDVDQDYWLQLVSAKRK